MSNAWDFTTPVWYEHYNTNEYPTFEGEEVSATAEQAQSAYGLFGFNPDGGNFELMAIENGRISGWPSSNRFILRKDDLQGKVLTTMIKAGQQAQLDVLLIANGVDSFVMYRDHTFHDLLDTVYSCPKTKAIAYYGNRLWALKGNLASFSDAFPQTYYPTPAKLVGDQTTFTPTTGDTIKVTKDGVIYDSIVLDACTSIQDVADAINAIVGSNIASAGTYPDGEGVLVLTSTTTGTSSNLTVEDSTYTTDSCIDKLFFATPKTTGGYAPFDRVVNAFRVPVGKSQAVVGTRDQGLVFLGDDQIWQLLPSAIPNPTSDFPQKVLDIGCMAGATAVPVADDVLFLAPDGIRGLFRTQLDKLQTGQSFPLSWPIPDEFERINWAQIDKACAVFFDNKYIISLPVDGSDHNNICWVYYPSYSSSYAKASTMSAPTTDRAWDIYEGWNIAKFATMNVGGQQKLYGLDSVSSKVYQMFKGKNDDGIAIEYNTISRAEDFGTPMQYKQGGEYKVRAIGKNGTLTVFANPDDSGRVMLGTVVLANIGVTFPTGFPVVFGTPQEVDGVFHLDSLGIRKFKRCEFEHELDDLNAEVSVVETAATSFQEPFLGEG
jgi:hypothetical protein